MSATMKTLIIRPADVSLAPLGAGSSVADARVSVVYDRDVWVNGQPVPRVPLISTSIPTAGLRVPVLASDDPSITEGAGFVTKVIVETTPRTGQHNDTSTSLARTIQVVTADPDEIPLGSKPNLTPVADPTQYADVMAAIRDAADAKASTARSEDAATRSASSAAAAQSDAATALGKINQAVASQDSATAQNLAGGTLTTAALRSAMPKASVAFGWYPVDAFGAIGVARDDARLDGDAKQAALAATNDAAFAAAWSAVLAAKRGGTIHIPGGRYPLNKAAWDAKTLAAGGARTPAITIQADGAALIAQAPSSAAGTTPGMPLMWIGASDCKDSAGMVRKVDIRGLSVQGAIDPLSTTKADRRGLVIFGGQEITTDRVWVSSFAWEGLTLDSIMDSDIHRTQILYCGNSSPTLADNHYALSITTTANTNVNAMRFHGVHVEFCPLMLDIDSNSMSGAARHIQFLGCKFEHGADNWGAQSPIRFGNVREVEFFGTFFVENWVTNAGSSDPVHFVFSSDDTQTGNVAHKRIIFSGCDFTTPDGRAAAWLKGAGIQAEACTFQGAAALTRDGGMMQPCFWLRDNSRLRDCTITVPTASGTSGIIATADLFRFDGKRARVVDPTIFVQDGQGGSLVHLTTSALGCGISGWRGTFGRPAGLLFDAATPGQGGITDDAGMDERFCFDDMITDYGSLWPGGRVLPAGTPLVFGCDGHVQVQGGTLTQLRAGYAGQRLTLEATGDLTIRASSRIALVGGASSISLTNGQCVTFLRRGGMWKQIGGVA